MTAIYGQFGSISHGTMRNEDLIPSFIDALDSINNDLMTSGDADNAPLSKRITDVVADIESRMYAEDGEYADGYFDSEDADYDLNEKLFDLLNEFAPPYGYFGSHPGDGSDYGFWLSEDAQEQMQDNDVLIVDDLSDVADDYRGEVCHINDHGNTTFGYIDDKGNFVEIWSLV